MMVNLRGPCGVNVDPVVCVMYVCVCVIPVVFAHLTWHFCDSCCVRSSVWSYCNSSGVGVVVLVNFELRLHDSHVVCVAYLEFIRPIRF